MPIDDTNRRKRDYTVEAIVASDHSPALKEDLTDILDKTLEGTNGFSPEEKLQRCTENMFNLARLIVLDIVSRGRRVTSWKDVAIAFKWPLVLMFGALCVTLILKPELAALVESIAHVVRQ